MEKYYIFKTYSCDFDEEERVSENLMRNTYCDWEVFHIGKDVIIYRKEVDKEERDKYYNKIARKVDELNSTFID